MSGIGRAGLGRLRHLFWPELSSEEGRETALAAGWLAALFAAAASAVKFAFGRLFGELPGELDSTDLSSTQIVDLCAVAAGVGLAWLIGKRATRLAAAILLAWILVAAAMKTADDAVPAVTVGAVFALAAINGLRASFARHRLLSANGHSPN